jgi:RNA polymerase sigma-70 factor (ECF subfamily)
VARNVDVLPTEKAGSGFQVRASAVAPDARVLDAESRAWLRDLSGDGPARDDAVARLHSLLLRAARYTLSRRRAAFPHLRGDLEEVALEAADDALVALLARLDSFRGASRFTTWAYGFAVLETSVKLRRLAWQGREIPLEPEGWLSFADPGTGPAGTLEHGELLDALKDGIEHALTPHQREVLVAVALNDVPIDVLAERLGSTRGALYKTIHDARRRLRAHLDENDLTPDTSPEGDA